MGRWVWLGWALPVALVFFFALREIGTVDYPWQLATGRLVAENGIPRLDPWLTTAEPRPWIEVRWLYCLALYGVVEGVGSWAATLIAAAFYAGAVCFVCRAGSRCSGDWLAVIGVTAVVVMGRRLSVRPEMATALLFGLALFLVIRMRAGRLSPRAGIPILVAMQLLWANLHGLFVLGVVTCLAWLVVEVLSKGAMRGPALVASAGVILASFANPYGVDGALLPLTLFGELGSGPYPQHIIELRSPFHFGLSPSLVAFFALALGVLLSLRSHRGDAVALLVCLGTFALAITTVRNAPLFALTATAYLSTCPFQRLPIARVAAGAIAVAVAYAFSIGLWTEEDRLGLGVNERRLPLDSAAALVREGAPQPIFNTLAEGAALVYQGSRVYADPRLEVLPPDRFERMLRISRLEEPLPEEFRSVLVALDSPLAAALIKSGGWRLVGMDRVAIALVRESGATVDSGALRDAAWSLLPTDPPPFTWYQVLHSPVPYRRMAKLFQGIGDEAMAAELSSIAARAYPGREHKAR